jgi:hypothetical protein
MQGLFKGQHMTRKFIAGLLAGMIGIGGVVQADARIRRDPADCVEAQNGP